MILSVSSAMHVLEALAEEPAGLSFAELQEVTKVEKSALSRVVGTLEAEGYVRRDPKSELVYLTIRYPASALRFLEKNDILQVCAPVLQEIADKTGELIQLAVSDGDAPIYVAKAAGRNRLQAIPLIGTRAVPHASTAGKLWLASMNDFDLAVAVGQLEISPYTAATKTDRTQILDDVKAARISGYAIIHAELSEDVSALGVPIKTQDTNMFVGALSLSAPTYRANQQPGLIEHLPLLEQRARSLAGLIRHCSPIVHFVNSSKETLNDGQ